MVGTQFVLKKIKKILTNNGVEFDMVEFFNTYDVLYLTTP